MFSFPHYGQHVDVEIMVALREQERTKLFSSIPEFHALLQQREALKNANEHLRIELKQSSIGKRLDVTGRIVANQEQLVAIQTKINEFMKTHPEEEKALYQHYLGVVSARRAMGRYFLLPAEKTGYGCLDSHSTLGWSEIKRSCVVYAVRDWMLGATESQLREKYPRYKRYGQFGRVVLLTWILKRCRDSGLVEDFYPGGEEDRLSSHNDMPVTDHMGYEGKLPLESISPKSHAEALPNLNFWLFQLEKQARLWNFPIHEAPPLYRYDPEQAMQDALQRKQEALEKLRASTFWRDLSILEEYLKNDITLAQVGERFGISGSRASQIVRKRIRILCKYFTPEEKEQYKLLAYGSTLKEVRQHLDFWLPHIQRYREQLTTNDPK